MPIQYVEADIAVCHLGVTVYHVYKCDDLDQGPRVYWFDLTGHLTPEADGEDFDVRELVAARGRLNGYTDSDETILDVLVSAIEGGELCAPPD